MQRNSNGKRAIYLVVSFPPKEAYEQDDNANGKTPRHRAGFHSRVWFPLVSCVKVPSPPCSELETGRKRGEERFSRWACS